MAIAALRPLFSDLFFPVSALKIYRSDLIIHSYLTITNHISLALNTMPSGSDCERYSCEMERVQSMRWTRCVSNTWPFYYFACPLVVKYRLLSANTHWLDNWVRVFFEIEYIWRSSPIHFSFILLSSGHTTDLQMQDHLLCFWNHSTFCYSFSLCQTWTIKYLQYRNGLSVNCFWVERKRVKKNHLECSRNAFELDHRRIMCSSIIFHRQQRDDKSLRLSLSLPLDLHALHKAATCIIGTKVIA